MTTIFRRRIFLLRRLYSKNSSATSPVSRYSKRHRNNWIECARLSSDSCASSWRRLLTDRWRRYRSSTKAIRRSRERWRQCRARANWLCPPDAPEHAPDVCRTGIPACPLRFQRSQILKRHRPATQTILKQPGTDRNVCPTFTPSATLSCQSFHSIPCGRAPRESLPSYKRDLLLV